MAETFTVPPFPQECKDYVGSSWTASMQHPFVLALADGSLDPNTFAFYQKQDARYLEAFSDACCILATKCVDPVDKLWFVDAAKMALVVEGQLHQGYGKKLGYTAEDIANLELTPNNAAYQNHMISTALKGSLVEGIAAILPCPWLYIELGQYLLKQMGSIPDDHPYKDWLLLYSDTAFNDYMNEILERTERFSRQISDPSILKKAKESFHSSVRYEYMFWDQAWNRQTWIS